MSNIFNRAGVRSVSVAVAAGMGAGSHPRISIRGGSFHTVDAAGVRYPAPIQIIQNIPTMLAVIVGANPVMSKVYFEGEYDPDQGTPPTCFSDNGVGPSKNAGRKMARTCAECPMNEWGSAVSKMTGKGVKACNDKKKIAVTIIGDPTGLVYELQVPPKSLKNLATYQGQLAGQTVPDGSRTGDVSDFVTGIQFTPDRTGELQFIPVAWLDSVFHDGVRTRIEFDGSGAPVEAEDGGAAIAGIVDAIWDSGQIDEIVGLKDQPAVVSLPAGERPQAYLESQPQGGALQRGSQGPGAAPQPAPESGGMRQVGGYAGQPGQRPAQPVQAFQPRVVPPATPPVPATPAVPARTGRGGARKKVEAPVQEDIPAFLRRGVPEPVQQTAAGLGPTEPSVAPEASGQGQPNFGMTNAPAPPAGIAGAIRAAMNLATGK